MMINQEVLQNSISRSDLTEALFFVKARDNEQVGKKNRVITENSRVNEQDLFAATIMAGFGKISGKALDFFKSNLSLKLGEAAEDFNPNRLFIAVQGVIKSARSQGLLSLAEAKILRHFAYDKAQLDQIKTRLSLTKEVEGSKDTAVRALSTALNRFETNESASDGVSQDYRIFRGFIKSWERKIRKNLPS